MSDNEEREEIVIPRDIVCIDLGEPLPAFDLGEPATGDDEGER